MGKYALNLAGDGRILSATFEKYDPSCKTIVGALPEGDLYDYRYVNGEFIHDPIIVDEQMEQEPTQLEPTQLDRIEAQVLYTALMTDTLIEEV